MNLLTEPAFQTAVCLFFLIATVCYFGLTGERRDREKRARLFRQESEAYARELGHARKSARALREIQEAEADIEYGRR